jgi:thiamine-monophosphate kinase
MQALQFKLDPLTCALNGGEDYELLFTIDPKDTEKVRLLPDIYIMGEITERREGIKLHSSGGKIHDLVAQGWKHF